MTELTGEHNEAIEQFKRLQAGVSLRPGELLHAHIYDPWYTALVDVADFLSSCGKEDKNQFEAWDKRWLFAGHVLAIADKYNPGIKYNLAGIENALGTSTCTEAADTAKRLLGYCAELDDHLYNPEGKFGYSAWKIETRYSVLYNLLSLTDVNKSHIPDLKETLREHLSPLGDVVPPLFARIPTGGNTKYSVGLLADRPTVDFSSQMYQEVFRPLRDEIWKRVPVRDEKRRFSEADRDALYKSAEGKCEGCGRELCTGWEAHHVKAWELGGLTVLENGQALCIPCHRATQRQEEKVDLESSAVV